MRKRFTLAPLLGIIPPALTTDLLNHRLRVGEKEEGDGISREGRERDKFPKRSGMGKDRRKE